jgi:coatomer protein complex subunit epsilon
MEADIWDSHSSLQKTDAQHTLLVDLAEKSELFDKAATKYKAKVTA